jgi:hypothetical protein
MMESLIALTVSFTAVTAINLGWQQWGGAMLGLTGWVLALISLLIWSWAFGVEFGITYGTIVFIVLVWIQVAAHREVKGRARIRRPYHAIELPGSRVLFKNIILFILSVPISGVLALIISVLLVQYLPWTMLNKVAFAVFLYPVLWGSLSSWVAAQDRVVKPVIVTAGLLLICGVVVFV